MEMTVTTGAIKKTLMSDFRKSYRALLRARDKKDYAKVMQEERLCLQLFHYCAMWIDRDELSKFISKNGIDPASI